MRTSRLGAAVAAALAVVGVSGCGLLTPDEEIPPATACGTEPAPGAGEPGDAEILLRAGFMIPAGPPRYVVYGDGAVVLVGEVEDDDAAAGSASDGAFAALRPVPAMAPYPTSDVGDGLYAGALPDCALDQLVTYADELAGLVDRLDGDLGSPTITDHGTAVLEYRPTDGGAAVEASAYALGAEENTQGVNREQLRARELMVALGDLVHANATALEPRDVEHLEIRTYPESVPDVDWPIATPLDALVPDGSCGEATGADAAALAEAERDGHEFLPEGGYLSLNALAPGETACA